MNDDNSMPLAEWLWLLAVLLLMLVLQAIGALD
jgi:hypothetical protein